VTPESIDPVLQLLLPKDPLRSLPEGTAILVKTAEIKGEKAILYNGQAYPAVLPDDVKLGEIIKVVLQAKSDILLLKLLDRPEAVKSDEKKVLRELLGELRKQEHSVTKPWPEPKVNEQSAPFKIEKLVSDVTRILIPQLPTKTAEKLPKKLLDELIRKVAETLTKEINLKTLEQFEVKVLQYGKVVEIPIEKGENIATVDFKNTLKSNLIKIYTEALSKLMPELPVKELLERAFKLVLEPKTTETIKLTTERVLPEQGKIIEQKRDEIAKVIESILKTIKKVDTEPEVLKSTQAMFSQEQGERSPEKILELVSSANEVLERIQEKRAERYAVFPYFYGAIGRVIIGELLARKNKKRRFRLFLQGFGELIVDIDDDKIILTASSKETFLLLKENIHIVRSEFPGLEVLVSLGQFGLLIPDFVQEKLSLARRA
jgi:hypothetical protein